VIEGEGRRSRRFVAVLSRIPFTAGTILAVLGVTAITTTLAHPIGPELLERWGFGIQDLTGGRPLQVFLAPFQILRPYMAISVTAILLVFVGSFEALFGTRRAAVVFWVGHVLGYTLTLLLLSGAAALGADWPRALLAHRDVGASNGAFAAAGALVVNVRGRLRHALILFFAAYLALAIVLEGQVWDFSHSVAFALGMALGVGFLIRDGRTPAGLLPRIRIERRQRPWVMAWAVAVQGAVNVLGAFLLPRHASFARLESVLPFAGIHVPRHLLLASGLTLLLLAPGLARGQRAAWWGTLVALALSLGLQSQLGMTKGEVVFAAVFLAALVTWHDGFRAVSDRPAMRQGWLLLALLPVVVLAYAGAGLYVLRTEFVEAVGFLDPLREIGDRLLFLGSGMLTPLDRRAAWFLDSIPLVGWGGILYTVTIFVRVATAPPASPSDRAAAEIIHPRYGAGGTSFMTLWPGNTLFCDETRESYLAYRVHAEVAVVLGDPVGPPELLPGLIRRFQEHCTQRGWDHAFYAATDRCRPVYGDLGYESLQIGEEAVIPLGALEFKGKPWQNMRSAINRAARSGLEFRMLEGGTVPPSLEGQLFEIEAAWQAEKKLPPMGFTLGRAEDTRDPRVNVSLAVDHAGRVHAYADWLPVPGRRGWVIDLMQRRSDAMPGVMEFLIGMSCLEFKNRGYASVSLATAPLADVDRDETSSLSQLALGTIFERFDTLYGFRSLFEFKDRFQPRWEPVYLVYRGLARLPAVTLAVLRSHFEGVEFGDLASVVTAPLRERLRSRGASPPDPEPSP